MQSKGTAEELERWRYRAIHILNMGYSEAETARLLGVTRGAISQWQSRYRRGGWVALAAKPHPSPTAKLSPGQCRRLIRLLGKGPEANGFPTALWTLARVAAVIEDRFGVSYDPSGVWRLLRRIHWSCRKPERRAKEGDRARIERWPTVDWPRLKKWARRRGWTLVIPDETGFRFQPTVRRTWGPQGHTPILDQWDRYDRLTGLSVLTVSPCRHRLDLYFTLRLDTVRTAEFEQFVAELFDHFPRGILLVLDSWSVRKGAVRRLQRRFSRHRLGVEWFPTYAPELNPTEQVWNHTKYGGLANFLPDTPEELDQKVWIELFKMRGRQAQLRSCFKHAKLKL